MTAYAIAYAATAVVFLGLDAVWLTLAAERLYRPLLGDLLVERFALVPAVAFYVVYILGIVVFAVAPALTSGRWTTAAAYGALLEFVSYATYDLTNQATLRGWPIAVTVADLGWGTVVTAVAATAGYLVARGLAPAP